MAGLIARAALVIAGVAVLAMLGVAFSYWMTFRAIGGDRERLVAAAHAEPELVTEARLASLPAAAQRYLRYAGVVGKPVPRIVTLTQKGRIRSSADATWLPLEADEIYSTNPPGFVWQAFMPARTIPLAIGRDEYLQGQGSILIKLLSLVPLADEHGPELKTAGLVRFLNEMMWFPAGLLGSNVTISEVDSNAFAATLTDHGETVRGLFFVDDQGRLTNFRARRYNTSTRSIDTWETPVGGYRVFQGYQLPSTGSAVWKLAGGDFTYIELEISDVEYRY